MKNNAFKREHRPFSSIFYRLICLFVISLVLFSAHADDVDSELTDARNIFLQGVDGDKRAVRRALKHFRSLRQRYPQNPVFLAYLGACNTLQGRDALNGIEKQRLTEAGLVEIDQALKMLDEQADVPSYWRLDTQLVAVNTFIYIPAFFNRLERGKRLMTEILENRDFSAMADGFKAAAYFTAAVIARGDGDESAYRYNLEQTMEVDKTGRNGRSARSQLDALGEQD